MENETDLSSLVNEALGILNPDAMEDVDQMPPPSYESLIQEEESEVTTEEPNVSSTNPLEQIQMELRESSIVNHHSTSSQQLNLMAESAVRFSRVDPQELTGAMANVCLLSAESSLSSPVNTISSISPRHQSGSSVVIKPSSSSAKIIEEQAEDEPEPTEVVTESKAVTVAQALDAGPPKPYSPPTYLTDSGTSDKVKVAIIGVERVETLSALGLKQSYHTYHLCIDSTLEGMLATSHQVTRRFSEFESLHRLLHNELIGYFIPPLPPKSLVDHKIADDKFLALRRIELSTFIGSIVAHEGILLESQALRLFLLQPGDLANNPAWTAICHSHDSHVSSVRRRSALGAGGSTSSGGASPPTQEKEPRSPPPPSRMGLVGNSQAAIMNQVGGFMTWMKTTGTMQNLLQPPERTLEPEETQLRATKQLLKDLNELLKISASAATNMRTDLERMASNSRELGQAFGMLSKYEEHWASKGGLYTEDGMSATRRSGDLQNAALVEARQTSIWRNLMHRTAMHLTVIHDHWALVPQAIIALTEREKVMDEILSLQEDLALKKFQLSSIQSNEWQEPPPSDKKGSTFGVGLLRGLAAGQSPSGLNAQRSYQLEQVIVRMESEVDQMRSSYQVIKRRNEADLTRMGLKREEDFRRMFKNLARDQSELLRASAEIWLALT